jgi:hypothetical protein
VQPPFRITSVNYTTVFEYANRRKLFKNRKSYNRRFTQGFAVFDLGIVKLLTTKLHNTVKSNLTAMKRGIYRLLFSPVLHDLIDK